MGGMNPDDEQEVPEKIKSSHFIGWWLLFVCFIGTFVGCLIALKIFDALIALMIGIWIYYLTKDSCKNMSQQCLFSIGLMCCMQAVMEFIILAMSLPGRRSTTTTPGESTGSPHGAPSPFMGGGHTHSSSYTVTTKTSPFFSEEEGWHYNLQSSMMIVNCVVFILGALLTRHSYGQYPNSLFEDRGESAPIGGGSSFGSGGGSRYGGRPANSLGGGGAQSGGGQRLGGSTSGNSYTFGGSGQRLGSV